MAVRDVYCVAACNHMRMLRGLVSGLPIAALHGVLGF